MEDLARDLERAVTPPGSPDSPKRSGGWTLLFIGSNGRIVRLERFKAFITVWVLVFIVASVSAVSFGFFYFDQASQNRSLKDAVRAGRERIDSMREEKEILLARVVLVEAQKPPSRSEGSFREAPLKQKEKSPAEEAHAQPIADSGRERAEKTGPVLVAAISADPPPKLPAKNAPPPVRMVSTGIRSLVEVEDFFSIAEPDSNTIRIKYKIRNIDPKSNPISGRTFLILKSGKEDPDKWIVLPEAPLESGIPSSIKNGQSFSITRFKTIRFKAPYHGPEPYETATILVFDTNGGLLLEKNFALIDREDESEPTG
ncbi:MAG: hypothetical protein C4530_03965 [Desulfobacteraceae bacterium]|nr:MAG: hypothetical protein C4530_03965 [Desulfobacteraceae bacterium]